MKILDLVPVYVIAIFGGLCFPIAGVILRYLLKRKLVDWQTSFLVTEIIVILVATAVYAQYIGLKGINSTAVGVSLIVAIMSLVSFLGLLCVGAENFKIYLLLAVSGIIFSAGILSIYLLLSVANMTYVITIIRGVSFVLTILLAMFFLKDKLSSWQYLGVSMVVVGMFITIFHQQIQQIVNKILSG